MNELIHGEALEELQKLIDKGVKVDAIICDTPYGTTKCKWDSIIDLSKMWEMIKQLVKDDNTPIVLFGAQPFTSVLVNSNLKGYKHHWIWEKNRGTGFQSAKYRPMMSTEDIIGFTIKGKRINYNPQMVVLDKPRVERGVGTKSEINNEMNIDKDYKRVVTHRYPKNVLKFDKVHHPAHPTQKPVELMEYLVKTYTNEGELVLDFTMGSGSTGVACNNLNRDFIGIELDEEYYNIAKNRVKGE